MAEPGPWLHTSASCHRTNCFDALLGEGKDSQGTRAMWSSLNEQSRIRVGLLCHSEGPGSGVLPQGKAVFCVVFLSCFLAMGVKAPTDWICKARRTTPGPEGRVTVGERSQFPFSPVLERVATGGSASRSSLSGCSFLRLMALRYS